MRWTVRAAALFAAACLLQGCASRLYSETRDKQGQELKAAYAKVDIDGQVATARKNYAAILEQQMKFEDDSWAFYRMRMADQMLSTWTVERLKTEIDAAIKAIALNDADVLSSASNAKFNRQQIDKEARSTMAPLGYAWRGCASIAGDKLVGERERIKQDFGEKAALVLNSLEAQDRSCQALATTQASGGELHAAQKALQAEQDAQDAAQTSLTVAQSDLNKAAVKYDRAQQLLSAGTGTKADLDQADEGLRKAIDRLKNLQSAVGTEFIAKTRLDKVNEFLTTYEDVAAGKGAPEGSSRLAIALGLYPELEAKRRAALADLQKPNLVPLSQQKMLEQAKLDAAQRDVDRHQQVLKWRQTYVDVLMERLATLHSAQVAAACLVTPASTAPTAGVAPVTSAPKCQKTFGLSDTTRLGPAMVPLKAAPLDVDKPADQAKALDALQSKQELWRIGALLLHAEGKLRADAGKARYQITALSYEESMSYAESSFQQWKALLDPSVDLASQYAASGLRAKDIQDLVNTLALLWIAVGVQ